MVDCLIAKWYPIEPLGLQLFQHRSAPREAVLSLPGQNFQTTLRIEVKPGYLQNWMVTHFMFDPKSSGTTLERCLTMFHHCGDASRIEIPPKTECVLITFYICQTSRYRCESLGSRVVTLAGSKRSLRDSCEDGSR